ncbi:hypothetical protein [Thermogutta sp.]
MALAARRSLVGVLVVCLSVVGGCSANKTGSQWSLATINPFKKTQSAEPYPQKPSAFATPSAVPGGKQGASLASTSPQGGPLYPSTTPRVYSDAASGQNAANSSTVRQASGDLYNNPVQNSSPYPPVNPYDPNAFARNQNQMVQAQPVGTAIASDSDPSSIGEAASAYPAPQSPAGTSAGARTGFAVPASGSSVPAYGGGLPVSYDAIPSSGRPGSYTGPALPQASVAGGRDTSAVPSASSSSALPSNTATAQTDWSQLVGDRYAQMYRQSAQIASPGAGFSGGGVSSSVGGTSYVPGDTGYVPGQIPNPPGNTSYQPGRTGYQPPGVPPYTPPYAIQNNAVTGASAETSGSGSTSRTSGEYRPGSTKTYIPRSVPASTSNSTSSTLETANPQGASVARTAPVSPGDSDGASFRL